MNKIILIGLGFACHIPALFAQNAVVPDTVVQAEHSLSPYDSKVSALDDYPYALNFTHQLSVATTGIRAATPSLPGMTTNLAVRGFSNVYYEQMPAVVVDGNLYVGSLSNINPYMIDELKVIKNPFESSLPLSLGADGVIEIKTKKHSGAKKWYFNFNTNAGIITRGGTDYDVFTDPGELYEFMYTKYRNELYLYGMDWEATKHPAANEFAAGYYLNNLYDVPNSQLIDINTGKFNRNARRIYDDDIYGRFERKNGFRNQHNFIASGLFKKGSLDFNTGYSKERSFIKELDFDRINLGLNGAWKPFNKLTVGFAASYAHQSISATEPIHISKQNISPLTEYFVRDNDGTILKNKEGADSVSGMFSNWSTIMDAPKRTATTSINPYLIFKLVKGLDFKLNAGFVSDKIESRKGYYRYNSFNYGENNLNRSMQQLSINPALSWYQMKGKHRWNTVLQLNHYRYKQDINYRVKTDPVKINITDGYSYQNSNLDWNSGYTFNNRIGVNVRLNREINTNDKNVINEQKYSAFNYAFGVHGSIIKNSQGYLSLVADYTSQKNFIHFNHERAFSSLEQSLLNTPGFTNTSYLPLAYFVPVLTSQKTYQVGLRAAALRDRLKFYANYFVRDVYNARTLTSSRIDPGYWSFTDGLDILNKGYEFEIQGKIIDRSRFSWNMLLTGTHFDNKFGGTFFSRGIQPFDGKSINSLNMPKWAGVDPNTGRNLYIKKDGTKVADDNMDYEDYTLFKGSDPVLWGSLGNKIKWKNVSVGVMLNYSLGGQVFDQTYAILSSSDRAAFSTFNVHKDLLKSWTPDNRQTDIPVTTTYRMQHSFFLTDASWLSLKNVNIQYELPQRMFQRTVVNSITAYLAGDNLLFLSKRQGLDPNARFGPIATSSFPMTRTIMIGFNLNF